jgi:hypothetical protein
MPAVLTNEGLRSWTDALFARLGGANANIVCARIAAGLPAYKPLKEKAESE